MEMVEIVEIVELKVEIVKMCDKSGWWFILVEMVEIVEIVKMLEIVKICNVNSGGLKYL